MIEARISQHELHTIPTQRTKHGIQKDSSPREMEQHVLSRLRNAGIPVLGLAFLVGLERGELSMRREPDGAYLYRWRDV